MFKKIISILVSLLLIVSLFGCASINKNNNYQYRDINSHRIERRSRSYSFFIDDVIWPLFILKIAVISLVLYSNSMYVR